MIPPIAIKGRGEERTTAASASTPSTGPASRLDEVAKTGPMPAIVDDQRRLRAAAPRNDLESGLQEVARRSLLVAKLHYIGAPVERGVGQLEMTEALLQADVGDDVQPADPPQVSSPRRK